MAAGWFGWAMPRRAYLRRQQATAKGGGRSVVPQGGAAVFGPVTKEDHALECAAARLRAERKVFRAQREVFLRAVKHYKADLEDASAELRADRRAVLAAVRHGMSSPLQYASAELRADREIVLAAVRTDGWALKYVCGELQADREVVLEALQFGMALSYASTGLRADREVVLAAVRQDPRALEFASTELRADQKLVLAALDGRPPACAWTAARAKGWGRSLKHASAELRSDREIVLAAVRQCNDLEGRWVLKHASAELRADREIGDHRDHYSGRLALSSPPDFLSRMGKGSVRKVDSVSSDYIHISDFWDSA